MASFEEDLVSPLRAPGPPVYIFLRVSQLDSVLGSSLFARRH
jgi:hypothetical protein